MDTYFRLLANPNKIKNTENYNYKNINYLKLHIDKKFEKLSSKHRDKLYYIINNYINDINIVDIIIKDIINNIISDIILENEY